jgi:RNA polymerase sigma-70 factor (sigma-E family)
MAPAGGSGREEPGQVVSISASSSEATVALAHVYASARPRLIGFARTVLADADGAEEVVQEAFARTLAHWDRVQDKDDPLPYLRSVILNLCRGRFRRRPTPLRPEQDEPSAESVAGRAARRAAVVDAMATLPERQREVVALRYFGELSTEETAEALGISPGTVKTHLHRATQALASRLQEQRHE